MKFRTHTKHEFSTERFICTPKRRQPLPVLSVFPVFPVFPVLTALSVFPVLSTLCLLHLPAAKRISAPHGGPRCLEMTENQVKSTAKPITEAFWWASLQKNSPKTGLSCSEADDRAMRCASLEKNCRKPCTTGSEAYAGVLICALLN